MLHPSPQTQAQQDDALVTKALMRAAHRLDLSNKVISRIIGVSEASVSRMKDGRYLLPEGSKAFELSLLLIRLFRSLDALTGGDDRVSSTWMKAKNTLLQATPVERIQTVTGLSEVIGYVDARRAVI